MKFKNLSENLLDNDNNRTSSSFTSNNDKSDYSSQWIGNNVRRIF